MKNLKLIIIGVLIGIVLGYMWHFFAVKDKLEVYRNYEQILKQKNSKIINLEFRSQLCCGCLLYTSPSPRDS